MRIAALLLGTRSSRHEKIKRLRISKQKPVMSWLTLDIFLEFEPKNQKRVIAQAH